MFKVGKCQGLWCTLTYSDKNTECNTLYHIYIMYKQWSDLLDTTHNWFSEKLYASSASLYNAYNYAYLLLHVHD